MNKKKKAVIKKHRKAKEGNKNKDGVNIAVEKFVLAMGRIRDSDLFLLKQDLKESELNRLTTVTHEKLDADYIKVTLKTKEVAKSLLEHSLREGLLRHWNDRIRIPA